MREETQEEMELLERQDLLVEMDEMEETETRVIQVRQDLKGDKGDTGRLREFILLSYMRGCYKTLQRQQHLQRLLITELRLRIYRVGGRRHSSGDIDNDTYDYYTSFADYNPASESLGQWATPFATGSHQDRQDQQDRKGIKVFKESKE